VSLHTAPVSPLSLHVVAVHAGTHDVPFGPALKPVPPQVQL
jgi:hypothetical protein